VVCPRGGKSSRIHLSHPAGVVSGHEGGAKPGAGMRGVSREGGMVGRGGEVEEGKREGGEW